MRLLPLTILLAGCAATTADTETREQRALDEELAGRTAGEARACVAIRQGEPLHIVDQRTLSYRDGHTVWVNRLDHDCGSLRPMNTLIIEANASQYCRGDKVRGVESSSSIPGPVCILRDFVPYRKVD
jgi:hypothetical protein